MRVFAGVVVAACALALLALALFVRDHAYSMYDDAFIYLRYVKIIRAGCGLRFNCDEAPVEGFSGPLWLLLLVLARSVTAKIVTATQAIGTLAMGATLVASTLAATQTHGSSQLNRFPRAAAACAVAGVLALDHYALLNAVIGLETGLAALVGVVAWAAVTAERRKTVFALSFAMLLLRPEGILLVLGMFVLPWARTRRYVLAAGGALALVTLVRFAIFHDVVANTVWAKAGGTRRHAALGAFYLLDVMKDFPAIVLAPFVLRCPGAKHHARWLLAIATVWLGSFVYSGGDTFSYARLAFPLVPALTVAAVQGVIAAAARSFAARRTLATLAASAVFFAIGGRAARAHALEPSHGFGNVDLWTAIGKHLKTHHRGKSVATVPIGAISYFSEAKVLDLVGLASREVAKEGRTVPPERLEKNWIGHERHFLEHTLAWAPDIVVTTKFRETAWVSLDEASAGFWSDWLLLRAAKEGRAPYRVLDLEIAEGVHVLALGRVLE